jgi:hypothetical protein
MNDAFGVAYEMNQDVEVSKAVKSLEAVPATAKQRHGDRYLLTHDESVEVIAKLGIFFNGDTKQVTELLNKIK